MFLKGRPDFLEDLETKDLISNHLRKFFHWLLVVVLSWSAFTFSKLTIETLE